tara:strand:- start:162 stop:605 length:444 start_codon:yes stop_codon:yes gene_type:complete
MRRLTQLLGLILLLFSACKSGQITNQDDKETAIVFELKKSGCYGTCPIFDIALYNDRIVKYHGKHFTENIGQFEWYISKENYEEIQAIIGKTFNQSQSFNMNVQDLPTTKLYIYKEIKIEFKGSCPKEFKKELNLIEQKILKNSVWK